MNEATGPIPAVAPYLDEERFRYGDEGTRIGWKQDKKTHEWVPLTATEIQLLQLKHQATASEYAGRIYMYVGLTFWFGVIGGVILIVLLVAGLSN